jgi:O-antigen/teichoic acid export membrane protein
MRELFSGAIATAAFVAALYFFKFWRRSADRLFVLFAAAFALLAANAVALGLTHPVGEFEVAIYLVRLAAFVLILVAIIDKNRGT